MKRIEIVDLPEEARDLVAESEASGTRTLFERNGRPVAILVSYDEYLALRETIEIANDAMLYARLEEADEQVRRGELFDTRFQFGNTRLRFPRRFEEDWNALSDEERDRVRAAATIIDDDPIAGAPLFEPLKGLWSYPSANLRVIYRIVAEAKYVVVLGVRRA